MASKILEPNEKISRGFPKKQGYAVIEAADGHETLDLFIANQD